MRSTFPVTSRARTVVGLAVGAGLVTALGACGDPSGADEAAIASTEEWCQVALEVDAALGDRTTRNTVHAELQDAYAETRTMVVRLLDALDHVHADHRDDVRAHGEVMLDLADAIVDAPDQSSAEAALTAVFEDLDPGAEAGRAWVDETCDPG